MPDELELREQQLSDFEKLVLQVIRRPAAEGFPRGVPFEEICSDTLLSPDIVTKVVAELVQAKLVRVVGQTAATDLQLTPVGARRTGP
jgi:hypothetical protein